jgi:hypothetical protein
MAYLIHANHWTLARAYSFVLERRKGISPNIGFVSELMTFEEQELGGKSVGVQSSSVPATCGGGGSGGGSGGSVGGNGASGSKQGNGHGSDGSSGGGFSSQQGDSYSAAAHHYQHRRGGHIRESLPPALSTAGMTDGPVGPLANPISAGGMVALGDSAHEREIKDAFGRYRHARRAPVDEMTLQPGRRVSKAGLESSGTS